MNRKSCVYYEEGKGCINGFGCFRGCDFYHPKKENLKHMAKLAYKDGRHWNRGGGLNK